MYGEAPLYVKLSTLNSDVAAFSRQHVRADGSKYMTAVAPYAAWPNIRPADLATHVGGSYENYDSSLIGGSTALKVELDVVVTSVVVTSEQPIDSFVEINVQVIINFDFFGISLDEEGPVHLEFSVDSQLNGVWLIDDIGLFSFFLKKENVLQTPMISTLVSLKQTKLLTSIFLRKRLMITQCLHLIICY